MNDVNIDVRTYIGLTLAYKIYESDIQEYTVMQKNYPGLKIGMANILIWRTESILKLLEEDQHKIRMAHRLRISVIKGKSKRRYLWNARRQSGSLDYSDDELFKLAQEYYEQFWYDPRIKIERKSWY